MLAANAVWLDVHRAAAHVDVSEPTILRAARAGALQGFKVGKLWRFRREDLDAWVMRRQTPVMVPQRGVA